MAKRSYVEDDDGNVTHVRETSDDGSRSWLYEKDDSLLGDLGDGKGELVEVADHNEDGTTDAYEADNSLLGSALDSKGEHKD